MKPKERVLRALNHEETDRHPIRTTFTPKFASKLSEAFGLKEMYAGSYQTECMDLLTMQEKYGERICFLGGIAVQSTLPNGNYEELKAEYDWLKGSLGKDGCWICAPTHHIQMDIPIENFFNLLKILGIEDKRVIKKFSSTSYLSTI